MSVSAPASPNTLGLPHRPLRLAAGLAIAGAIAALVAMVLFSIARADGNAPTGGSIDLGHLLRMTSIQAGLTTLLSLVVGTGLAWALNRLRFFGRTLVVGLFSSAIVTPGLIIAFGLLSVWGRTGWINWVLDKTFGLSIGNPMFGLQGILAAHVILDAAFAARIILARLDAIPATRLKTGQSLALSAWKRFSVIDWPAIRGTLPGLGAIIFLLAFTSFPIVLLLGGGPANQTLEVAIYSAVRLDFDLKGAVTLALAQIAACSLVILISVVLAPIPSSLGPSRGQSWADSFWAQAVQWALLAICTIAFALPLLAVLIDGLTIGLGQLLMRPGFWKAAATSLAIGALSACLTLVFALTLAMGRAAAAQ
jgi:thiamine transport system permease protein